VKTKEMIYLGAAVIGAYAAWLNIKEKQRLNQAAFSDWFTSGSSFNNTGSFDFYGYEYNTPELDELEKMQVLNTNKTNAAWRF
jgi:hypothetical protein